MPLTQPQNFFVTAVDNSFGGTATGQDNNADRVTAIGARAAQRNALGADDVIVIGVDAGQDNLGARQIIIGNDSGGSAGAGLLTGDNIIIGHNVMVAAEDAEFNVVIGNFAAENIINQANQDFDNNVIIGHLAVNRMNLANFSLDNAVMIGFQAGERLLPTGGGNGGSVHIGSNAGRGTLGANVASLNNVFIGRDAANKITTPSSNVAIGQRAGDDLADGVGNIFIGASAGQNEGTGDRNVFIGNQSGIAFNFFDDDNIIIGDGAGAGRQGDRNIIIGRDAQIGPNSDGDNNIVIGARANSPSFAGSRNLTDNLLIEVADTGTRQTFILGVAAAGGASFIFGNNNVGSGVGTAEDLAALVGDGANNILKLVDGAKAAATNPVAGGYFYISAGALHWVGSAGTDTTVAVA